MDPERVHHLALSLLEMTPLAALLSGAPRGVSQPVRLWGLEFRNRLGLAAGFDKNAVALPAWHALGFGFAEIGTVTRYRQDGNPRPRIFRCPEVKGLVNRLGFPNDGADAIVSRLRKYRKQARPGFPVGANIGLSKITPLEEASEDYLYSLRTLYAEVDFFVVNVSSPNTPGLRELQSPERLEPILRRLQAYNREHSAKPLLVKVAPDLTEGGLADIIGLAGEVGLDGIVATNTTVDHSAIQLDEKGGLSGRPLAKRSTEVIRFIHQETNGRLPIIGVGGVFTADDYREKLDAGATLVEVYTALVYQGPRVAAEILGG